MDPPKELTMSDVTEDAVTISWIKPLAPFEYYKLSYQSARGKSAQSSTNCKWCPNPNSALTSWHFYVNSPKAHCCFSLQLNECGICSHT